MSNIFKLQDDLFIVEHQTLIISKYFNVFDNICITNL